MYIGILNHFKMKYSPNHFWLLCLGLILVGGCQSKITLPDLQNQIEAEFAAEEGIFALAFKDLSTGEELLINAHESFHAASTMKTPVMIEVYKQAAEGELKGYLRYSDEELVSSDFIGDPHSAIFDAPLTSVVQGNLVKVVGWYDNEYGYSSRVVDLLEYVGEKS